VTGVEALFQSGERITRHEYGQGVVLGPAHAGYTRLKCQALGRVKV